MENEKTGSTNVLLFLENKTEELGNRIALGTRSALGWQELTYRGISVLSKRLASYLMSIGVDKGDKVAILSESMPEWGAAIFASAMSGGTTVPLDIKLTMYELISILDNCKPKIIITSTTYLETAEKLKEGISSVEHIIIMNDAGKQTKYACLHDMADMPDRKWRHRSLNSTAFIIYTSGTTGDPKGVEISFKNVLAQIKSVRECFPLSDKDQLLSILPMNHLFELTVGFLSFLNQGVSIYYSKSLKPKDIFEVMQSKKVTFMVAVPAFLKLVKTSIEAEVAQSGKFNQFMFKLMYNIASFIPFLSVRKLIFRKIHKKLGGKFHTCVSGGAPLDLEVCKFLQTIGLRILEGYGLSEASPVVATNVVKAAKFGSVGRPIPGVKAKIDKETGELLIKGDNVMKGYYQKPELTKEVIDEDGWLHTGDIARIEDGFIFITGRIKNMIVLSGGKKVFPEEVESVMEQSEHFKELCVFGTKRKGGQKDGTEDVTIVVVPKDEWIEGLSDEEAVEKVKKEVKTLSQRLSSYKRPVNVYMSKEPLPRTATTKVKRNEVKAKYQEV